MSCHRKSWPQRARVREKISGALVTVKQKNMKQKKHKFTIRPLGYASWADTNSWRKALQLQAEAKNHMAAKTVIIYDNELGRIVRY